MPARNSKHVRLFKQAGNARLKEATILRDAGHSLGAIYLAGYSVECFLKSLILAQTPEHRQRAVIESFRGSHAHDYRWLRRRYSISGGATFPVEIVKAFVIVGPWQTYLRYQPGVKYDGDTDDFFRAVGLIGQFANART